MSCPQCKAIEESFTGEVADEDLTTYLKKGPDKSTRLLIEAITANGVAGLTLLDIGGGVGSVQHALLAAGVQSVTGVDASSAYLRVAQEEAGRRQLEGRVNYLHGDFVELANSIPPADIVTLDKVICCYPDMEKLVGLSAGRALSLYGLVYPRDAWWARFFASLLNFSYKIRRNPFRVFVHPSAAVEAILSRQGLTRRSYRRSSYWQVAIYTRL